MKKFLSQLVLFGFCTLPCGMAYIDKKLQDHSRIQVGRGLWRLSRSAVKAALTSKLDQVQLFRVLCRTDVISTLSDASEW